MDPGNPFYRQLSLLVQLLPIVGHQTCFALKGESRNPDVRARRLVWHEVHETMKSAITREKALKNWNRAWKIHVIETMNPQWRDLYSDLL